MRQLLTEGLMIGGLAAAVGMLITLWLGPVFISLAAIPTLDFYLDGIALGTALTAALASGVVSSLWPAWRASGATRPQPRRNRRALLTAQAAVCLTVLGVAGLLERGAVRAQSVDVGFDADRVWTVNALVGRRSLEDGHDRLRRAQEVLSAHPAIDAVAVGSGAFGGSSRWLRSTGGSTLYVKRVGPAWFSTLGVPLIAGRGFVEADVSSDNAVIVSRSTADHVWGRENAVGRDAGRLHPLLAGRVIVGVAADAVPHSLLDVGAGAHGVYRPLRLEDLDIAQLFVRTSRPAPEAFDVIRTVMASAFPDERIRPLRMDSLVEFSRQTLRAPARALSIASAALLVLALIGIAGVAATFVRLRQRDLAVHAVLGADARRLRALVARQCLAPVSLGIAFGAVLAACAGYGMRALLVDVHPADPLALGGAALLLLGGAWLASLGSARRATTVQPADVLRD